MKASVRACSLNPAMVLTRLSHPRPDGSAEPALSSGMFSKAVYAEPLGNDVTTMQEIGVSAMLSTSRPLPRAFGATRLRQQRQVGCLTDRFELVRKPMQPIRSPAMTKADLSAGRPLQPATSFILGGSDIPVEN